MTKFLKITLVVLVLLIAGIGEWFYIYGWPSGKSDNTPTNKAIVAGEPIYQKTDTSVKTKVPEGFPSDIPLEPANIVNSYKVNYESQGLIQFTISYNTSKTRDELFDLYYNYMNSANFVLTAGTSKKLGQVIGTKAGSTLSINLVTDSAGKERVELNYLYRKAQ